jgi:hypothetical protein
MRVSVAFAALMFGLYFGALATREWADVGTAAYFMRQLNAERADHAVCIAKRDGLLRAIRAEGLWKRLGLHVQPHLR